MKIFLNRQDQGIGHQILDAWHAYQQHKNSASNYVFNAQYQETQQICGPDSDDYDLSILLLSVKQQNKFPEHLLASYDLILMCNGGETLQVGSPTVKDWLSRYSNTYLISNSYLAQGHAMSDKNIWFPHNIQTCRDYWTRHFYPQYFENREYGQLPRKKVLEFINGQTRANRKYFIDLLLQANADIPIRNSLGTRVVEVADSQWESPQDTAFKTYANNLYTTVLDQANDYSYYDNTPTIGINNQFGLVLPGYFVLPLYFETWCVVFPEAGWQNNELNVTEKAIKCFYAGSLPFPIGGANINKLYNEIGFSTAWNLLPPDLQKFDSEVDHALRYQGMVSCVSWLADNAQVFESALAQDMITKNKINFLTCDADYRAIVKFDTVLHAHTRH